MAAPARRAHDIAFALLLLGAGLGPLSPTLEDNLPFRLIIQSLLLLSAAVWVAGLMLEERVRIRRTGVGWAAAALLAVLGAATWNASYGYPSVLTLLSWVTGAAAFVVTVHAARSPERRLMLFLTLGATTLAVSLHGIHQALIELPKARAMFQDDTAAVMRMLNLPLSMAGDFEGRLGRESVFSTFLLATSLAGYLALMLPGLAGYLLDWWRARRLLSPWGTFLLACALALPMAATLYLTKSKGGWAAFGVGMAVFVVWTFREEIRKRRMQAACLALAGLVVWGIAQRTALLPPLGDYAGSFVVRYKYWRAGLSIAEQHPGLGVGLDNFADYYAAAKHPEDQEARRAHNDYVQLAAEAGLAGLAAYAVFWRLYWRRVRRGAAGMLESAAGATSRPSPLIAAGVAAGVFLVEGLCGGRSGRAARRWG